jgi:cystathionine beta-lyase/cystathionine gamma-synthase
MWPASCGCCGIRSYPNYGREGEVRQLEDSFCELLGLRHALATSSGTAALHSAQGMKCWLRRSHFCRPSCRSSL